jgi:predicted CXXCH cytochrome family protein
VIGAPLLDFYRLQLLDPGAYHADGQIDGEVFEHGSFLQSRMYRAGVTCSDCHDPHSLRLREEGNAVCVRCHRAEAFDTAAHHFHAPGQPGSNCVDCHMPAKTYMVVDPRHDHAFRVPRPDLAAATGAPDPCTSCHADKDAAWAAGSIAEWYGPDRRREPTFGEALGALRAGAPDARARLVDLADDIGQPAIARATAVAALGDALDQRSYSAVTRGLGDPEPLVRLAAVGALAALDPRQAAPLLLPLLDDPVRGVRLEAARALAPLDAAALPPDQRLRLEAAFRAYEAAQSELVDRAAGLVTLANFYRDRGRLPEAEARLRDSIRLHPRFLPAYANLADLLRRLGRDSEGGAVLEAGLAVAPDAADLHHARGLWLVRRQRYSEAVAAFGRAATLAPEDPWYAYVHAVALEEIGRGDEALAVLQEAARHHPGDPDVLFALAAALLERGDRVGARRHAETLLRIAPGHPSAEALRRAIDAAAP